MRILFLGGTRFIGAHAVRRLAGEGHDLAVFHRGATEAPLPEGVAHIHGERAALAEFRSRFREFAPEVVVDMTTLGESHGRALVETLGGIAARAVVISSCDVYRAYDRLRRADPGPPDRVPLTEESPLRDRLYPYRDPARPEDRLHDYDKILVERAVMGQAALPAAVLRLPMVYGPGDYQHRLFEYLKRMDDRRPHILIAGDLARWRGLRAYVEDVALAIALAATNARSAGRIYHVAEEDAVTEEAWIGRVAEAAGWTGRIVARPEESLPAHLRHGYDTSQDWSLDSLRIRQELGYREVTPPGEAMLRTVAWERANPPAVVDPAAYDYPAEDAALG